MLPCLATLHASAITGMVHPHFSSTYSASNALHVCVDTSVHSIHFSFLCSLHTIFCSVGFSPPAGFCHGPSRPNVVSFLRKSFPRLNPLPVLYSLPLPNCTGFRFTLCFQSWFSTAPSSSLSSSSYSSISKAPPFSFFSFKQFARMCPTRPQ